VLTIPWFEWVLHCAVQSDLKFVASKVLNSCEPEFRTFAEL
jgi:hypothetical protein